MVYYIGYKPPFDRMSANKNLDGDPLEIKLRYEGTEAWLQIAKGITAVQAGLPIDNEYLPTVIQITSGNRAVTDFDGYNGLTYISPAMKAIIQQFEPNVHQFFPVKLVNRKKEWLADHWIWVVCNRIDSVDREHTNWFFPHGTLWIPQYLEEGKLIKVKNPRLVLSNQQSAGYHFWRDKYLKSGFGILCSDEAGQALQSEKLAALAVWPLETV